MFRVGIIGAGTIAGKMAETLNNAPQGCQCYAISSRSLEKAKLFAEKWGIEKAFGSYEEMLKDPDVDFVYVATPHSHHYDHARLCIDNGKPCLVEKSFTANAQQAEELLAYAKEKGIFITEAIWTRYLPLSMKVKEVMESGIVGEPRVLTATLCYNMTKKQRIFLPELCGGALLDVGVYCLNFARMYFGTDIVKTASNVRIDEKSGMDVHECISLSYSDGRMATLQAGALCLNDRQGIISCTEGYIRVDNVNCPEVVEVYRNYELVASYNKPADMVTGYEYQVYECRRCIEQGLLESPMMPHKETISIMQQMDELRKEWGVVYPMDK